MLTNGKFVHGEVEQVVVVVLVMVKNKEAREMRAV